MPDLKSFKQLVTDKIETVEVDGTKMHRAVMTEQERLQIGKAQTAEDIETWMTEGGSPSMAVVAKTINVENALESLNYGSQTGSNLGIISDRISYLNLSGQHKTVNCSVAKVSNCMTSQIRNGDMAKLYARCSVQSRKESSVMFNKQIRDTSSVDYDSLNKRPEQSNVGDIIEKKLPARDVGLSSTIARQDYRYFDIAKSILEKQNALKETMVKEFLQWSSNQNLTDKALMSIYKDINRSAQQNIFDLQWLSVNSRPNPSDPVSMSQYVRARSEYFDYVSALYGRSSSAPLTIQFGLDIMNLDIAEKAKWSSARKINHVKQYGSQSYYVSTTNDTGYKTIPTTKEILVAHQAEIDQCVYAALNYVELETEAQMGLDITVPMSYELPRTEAIKAEDRNYAKLLGITEDKERSILSALEDELMQAAQDKVEAVRQSNAIESMEGMTSRLGL